MRRSIIALITALLLTSLFTSCSAPSGSETDQTGPQPVSVSTVIPTPTGLTPTPIPHAPEIRFGLVGKPTDVNVWALFDEQGASYANYALRNDYWPRLFYLSPPGFIFTPRAATGTPTPVIQEGDFFTSTVSLRSDLKWTDGSSFTAEDVAFTVNAVLHFELGFDWKAYYAPDYLARAEAVDPSTVKFYFKRKPNVGAWQYGALQGPVVQRNFWEPKIQAALALLPDVSLPGTIDNALTRIAEYQPTVVALSEQFYTLQAEGKYDRRLEMDLKRNQGNLDEAQNDLTKALAEYADQLKAAHQALYALDDQNEPTLGAWKPAEQGNDQWVNAVNIDFPFEKPNFDRAVYLFFASEEQAITALENGQINFVLAAGGISTTVDSSVSLKMNRSRSAQFLVFNPARMELMNPALRAALDCTIDRTSLSSDVSQGEAMPLESFVLPEAWRNPNLRNSCTGMDDATRMETVITTLKAAGFTWSVEPTAAVDGAGLTMPDGAAFPQVTLLAPAKDEATAVAQNLETRSRQFGIPLTVEYGSLQDIRYDVLSSKKYDLAILGWRLSQYPRYLCEWFGGGGQFGYKASRPAQSGAEGLWSECDALAVESDLEIARQHFFEIQSILAEDLPFIPLYTGITWDAYQNLDYPFESVWGGLSSLYGAPSFAIPSP